MINWRRIIATGTVAGMIAITGCSANMPEVNQANRNGQRVVDATTRRADGERMTRANRNAGRMAVRETVPTRSANRSLNFGRPQGRIGNAFRYNHNNAGRTYGLNNHTTAGRTYGRSNHGYDMGVTATDAAIVNNRTTRSTAARPMNEMAMHSNRTNATHANNVNETIAHSTRVAPRSTVNSTNKSTRSTEKRAVQPTRNTAPKATKSTRNTTHNTKTAKPTRSTAPKATHRNTAPNRATTNHATANHTIANTANGQQSGSNRYHLIPHSATLNAIRDNTKPAPVAQATRVAQNRHRVQVNSQNNQRTHNALQNRAARRNTQFNRVNHSAQTRVNNRIGVVPTNNRTVAVMNQDDESAFFKRDNVPSTEPNVAPSTTPSVKPGQPAPSSSAPSIKPDVAPAPIPAPSTTPAPKSTVSVYNDTDYDSYNEDSWYNNGDYQQQQIVTPYDNHDQHQLVTPVQDMNVQPTATRSMK